jgi:type VI secretion system Hcp family effector
VLVLTSATGSVAQNQRTAVAADSPDAITASPAKVRIEIPTLTPKEGIEGFAFDLGISIPVGPGGVTGRANFQDVRIVKTVDTLTVELVRAAVSGRVLPMVTIRWQGTSPDGRPEDFLIIELFDVFVTSVQSILPNQRDPALMQSAEYEQVTFRYARIRWTSIGNGRIIGSFCWDILAVEPCN